MKFLFTFFPSWLGALFALTPAATGQTQATEPFRFGPFEREIHLEEAPLDVAVTAEGRIYVLTRSGHIDVFERSGKRLERLSPPGGERKGLAAPGGLALGSRFLYASDTGNHRIQRYSYGGKRKKAWGRLGKALGEFNQPLGLTLAGERLYVADSGNRRIQVLDLRGRALFALQPDDASILAVPVDVAVHEDGRVFVADAGHHRIHIFDAEGTYVTVWGDWGPFPGLFDQPSSLNWFGDRLWVVDRRNHRLQSFNAKGTLDQVWGIHERLPHQGKGKLHYPDSLAFDPGGRFAVLAESLENRLQLFGGGELSQQNAAKAQSSKRNRTHFGFYPAINGNLLAVAEPEMHFVFLFDINHETPIIINQFGERGQGFGLMGRVSGLLVDQKERRAFTSDLDTRRIQEYRLDYDPAGPLRFQPQMTRFAKAISFERLEQNLPQPKPFWRLEIQHLKRGPEGDFYVVDTRNEAILVFSPDWTFLRRWGGFGSGPGRFRRPTDLAFSKAGDKVFVADSLNGRIQVFQTNGTYLAEWGRPTRRRGNKSSTAKGRLLEPFGVSAGHDGFVYVSDWRSHHILKYDEAGNFIARWGGLGDDMGQLWYPAGMAQDAQHRLFVIDYGNHRAQIFSPAGEWLVTFGAGRAYTPKNRPKKSAGE